ncbi:MAG: class I tRNA ligase family protein, partial [Streptosporangiales bacterium]|nr:class I tRNA ligase family protein [Streptosporangiales bacterium]
AVLGWLADVVDDATAALDDYDHTGAIQRVEDAFWAFCDDHVELVKARAYGERGADAQASAHAALRPALAVFLRLLAPFLPYVTEEVWSWWRDGSVHRSAWPSGDELRALAGPADTSLVASAGAAVTAVRRAKSGAKLSMRADVAALRVTADAGTLAALRQVLPDVQAAGRVARVALTEADVPEPAYEVDLG